MFTSKNFELANLERIERNNWRSIAEFEEAIKEFEFRNRIKKKISLPNWIRTIFKKKPVQLVPSPRS